MIFTAPLNKKTEPVQTTNP